MTEYSVGSQLDMKIFKFNMDFFNKKFIFDKKYNILKIIKSI